MVPVEVPVDSTPSCVRYVWFLVIEQFIGPDSMSSFECWLHENNGHGDRAAKSLPPWRICLVSCWHIRRCFHLHSGVPEMLIKLLTCRSQLSVASFLLVVMNVVSMFSIIKVSKMLAQRGKDM